MSMCRVISSVVGRGCLLWPVCSLGKTLLALPCFILYSKAKLACYSRYFLISYFCIPESIFHYWLFTERVYFTVDYLLKCPQSLEDLLSYLVHGYIFGLNSHKGYRFGFLSLFSWSLFYILSQRCAIQMSHDFSWFTRLPQVGSCESWTMVMDNSSSEIWTVLLSLCLMVSL